MLSTLFPVRNVQQNLFFKSNNENIYFAKQNFCNYSNRNEAQT